MQQRSAPSGDRQGLQPHRPAVPVCTVCTVTDDAPGRTFAFDVAWPSKTSWRYDVIAVDDGTQVTLTMTKWQPRPAAPVVAIQHMVGVHDRAEHLRKGMDHTLKRLAQQLQQATPHPSTR